MRPQGFTLVPHRGEGIPPQGLDLASRELPPLPRQKIPERETTDRDTLELMHLVAKLGEHAADLTVLAFVENHFENRALFVLAAETHPLGMDFAFGQANALPQPLEQIRARHTGHLYEVFFFDTVAGMREQVRQVAIVREENETFARTIEPPHGEESSIPRHEIDDTGSTGRIIVRGHHADGLVEKVDDPPRIRELLTVDSNFLGARIDLGAERGHDLAIHFDAPRCHELFTGTTASETGRSQDFLESFEAIVGVRLARSRWPPRAARTGGAMGAAWLRTTT